jgi:HPt (histidine-containing phosphotransfer) domain-containing protein
MNKDFENKKLKQRCMELERECCEWEYKFEKAAYLCERIEDRLEEAHGRNYRFYNMSWWDRLKFLFTG